MFPEAVLRAVGVRSLHSLNVLRDRLPTLSHQQLAQSVRALHRGPTPRSHELAIRDIFLSLTGAEFQRFKYLLNSLGDYHDLEHLLWEDIDDPLIRLQMLDHIQVQGALTPSNDLRVLSDIDDTLKCALHDRRYPRGTVYPGYVALIHALDEGASADPGRAGDLTFVTARPSGPRGLIEMYTRNSLSGIGLPEHSVLGGSFLNVHSHASIAARKIANMERERQIFPECRLVFVGDSGQADGRVGAQMHRRDPEHIVGTLLHNVTALTPQQKQAWAEQGVYAFDTYAGAAQHALRLGLINTERAREVAQATADELQRVRLTSRQRQHLERALAEESIGL